MRLAFIAVHPIVTVMLRKLAFFALVPLLLAGSDDPHAGTGGPSGDSYGPYPPTYDFNICPGAASAKWLALVQRLYTNHPETRAVLITADGCTVLSSEASGYDSYKRFISWSMAKTVTGMLVGALVTDGRLKLDAPAPIAEWHKPGDPRAAITLRHLLQMSSGLRHVEVGDPVENSDTNQTLFVSHTDAMAAAAIDHPLATKPGSTFHYSSLTSIILAEIITRTLTNSHDPRIRAKAYTDFARTRLFAPAGIESAVLEFDGAGTQIGGSIIHMTPDDWGRIGGLLLDGKAGDGRQVVDPTWLAFMKTPSPTNAEYGAQLWLNHPGGAGGKPTLFPNKGPATAVAADGHLGQLVIASPDSGPGRGLVVVRLGNTPDSRNPALMQALGDVVAAFDRPATAK